MKRLILTAGLPGAGKSTVLSKSEYSHLPVVDPDEVKKTLPGYDPLNPQLVHDESKLIARENHLMLLSKGESFVVDGTGTNVEKYLQWINEARELGYTIVLFYVKVAASTSLKRNARRDRKVPEEVIVEKAGIINQSTELIGSVCDKFVVLKND